MNSLLAEIVTANQLRARNRTVTRKGGEAIPDVPQNFESLSINVSGTVHETFVLGVNSPDDDYWIP